LRASSHGSTHAAVGAAGSAAVTVAVRSRISSGTTTSPAAVRTHTGIEIRIAGVRSLMACVCSALTRSVRPEGS
jgi:hypothetical protein